jgi:solute carrier family 25 (peroxisomal adenine nucleotide transporter), member 17
MAKVRIQARSADAEDSKDDNLSPPHAHKSHHGKGRHPHSGALDILKRVWKEEGFRGWYQVRHLSSISLSVIR